MLDESLKEFMVSADIYLSNHVCTLLRKPKGRPEKRDNTKQASQGTEDTKRVKEKTSWLTLSKDPTTSGLWRFTLCRLSELDKVDNRCVLNIYLDESILFCTINLHLVHTANIRLADKSLFEKRHCLSIHCTDPGQYWSVVPITDPIYLSFEDPELRNIWVTLLRSYAIPEVYGRTYSPTDGGFYRMWRRMDLSIHSVRNLGQKVASGPKAGGASSASHSTPSSTAAEPELVDMSLYCDVYMNNVICGRTTSKKLSPISMWMESFSLQDLPPFEALEIAVWRDKKAPKSTYVGSATIVPNNFSRGTTVEGWFPILLQGAGGRDMQVGEIKLTLAVHEELILPRHVYDPIMKLFRSRNSLDWVELFEKKLGLKDAYKPVLLLSIAHNNLVSDIHELIAREIENTSTPHTIFRGNTVMTKMMEHSMAHHGKAFLEASIGPVLRRLCTQKISIEPETLGGAKGSKEEKNSALLVHWCQEFWDAIYATRGQCPEEMRRLFESIRKLVDHNVQKHEGDIFQENRDLPWQSVSAFCFLRFIVPAILHPHLSGLHWGAPPPSTVTSLKLIAKVIQSLANLNTPKEEQKRDAKDWFCVNNRQAMIDYLFVVSTPARETIPASFLKRGRSERMQLIKALNERAGTKSVLDREALILPPQSFDVPLQMAHLASAVIRSHRSLKNPDAIAEDKGLYDFCARCYEVERNTFDRVEFLAKHMRPGPRSRSPSPDYSLSPIERVPTPVGERSFSQYRSPVRPSTAPAQSVRRQFSPQH